MDYEYWGDGIVVFVFFNCKKRKGKPTERRGRKASGLTLKSNDSRAAERDREIVPLGQDARRHFFCSKLQNA
jgi:hypothetical protein